MADGSSQKDIETDNRRIRSLAFSPDGRWLAAAGTSTKIRLFDTTNGNIVKTLDTRPAKVYTLVFLDNHRLATGGTDDRITVWDLDSQQPISQLVGHTGTVAALACDGTGNVLVSGSYDTTLCIWNLGNKQIPATARARAAGEAANALARMTIRVERMEAARGNIRHTSPFVLRKQTARSSGRADQSAISKSAAD